MNSAQVGIFSRRGLLRVEDVLLGREFALIGVSRSGAEWLLRFLVWYFGLVDALARRLLNRVPSWFFNGLFWLLRLGKASLLRAKLQFVLNDPQGMADHPDWIGVL